MPTAGEGEAKRQKKRKMKKHKEQVGVAPSPSPHAPATPESKPLPLIRLDQTPAPSAAPETPILEEEAAATARRTKERKRKKRKEGQEQVAAPSPPSPPAAAQTPIFEEEEGEAVMARKKRKRKRWKHEEEGEKQMPSSPSPPTAAGIPLLEGEEEEETATRRKKWKRRGKEKQEQAGTSPQAPAHPPSGQSPLPFDPGCSDRTHCVHLHGTPAPAPTPPPPPPEEEQEEAAGPKGKGVKRSNSKKPHVLSTRDIIKMRMELRKQQPLPKGFVAAMTMTSNPNSDSNCIEQNTNHSSPFGAFFDQFCYKPVRQDRNPALPRTPDRLARPPPRGHPSSEWSHLTANETSKAAKANTSIASKSKQPGSGSGSVPGSQAKVKVKEKEKPAKKTRMKKQRKPPPLLTRAEKCSDKYHRLPLDQLVPPPRSLQRKPPPLLTRAEKCSDKYRRLPLDQLVPPPRSPHKLLQEKYASDPWKVVVICMLLNLTHGKQVRKKVKGFFKRYPDAQTAFNADPEKMAKYLAPLGLQRVKANRIQKFSKAYVEKEWTYITELCGVGKYAADAYAIFCAGRATEVVPEDHKLVDYWKYVCFELPTVQRTQNVQEAVVTELENVVPEVQELAVCC